MSVSLYQPYIKNEDLKNNFNPLKWPRVCIDPVIWNCTLKNVSVNPVASWSEIPFSKSFKDKLDDLDGEQGIYMFVVKAPNGISKHQSFIVYIGETQNLKERYNSYFNYCTTKNTSDQKKRFMVVVWEELLHFNYIKTNLSTKDRKKYEYELIDAVVPPINDDFQTDIVKEAKKLIQV